MGPVVDIPMIEGCQGCPEYWKGNAVCEMQCESCPLFWDGDVFDGGDCDHAVVDLVVDIPMIEGCQGCPEYWKGNAVCDMQCESCPVFWTGDVFDGGDCDHVSMPSMDNDIPPFPITADCQG